ncbi:MAG: Flp pilus assembly complex ATPase component [Fuerstiella sp.]|nr:Flp pilus assembly complex ATPase component [Fuerstiella sp.]
MGRGDDEDDDHEEDMEQVLFQGPMFGRETNLKQNARLVKAALVPVKKMISDGLSRRAHTILLEPSQGRVTIRFIVDGIPYPAGAIPGQRGMAMIQMIKVLAGLNPQERNEAQSGGMNAEFEEVRYELLTETTLLKPGVERLKIRVENPKITYLKPADAGMPDEVSKQIRGYTEDSSGIILVCGPPDSGVTSLSICTIHCVDLYLYSVFSLADTGGKQLTNVSDYEQEEGHDLEFSFDRILRREADAIFMDPLTDPAVVQTMCQFADRLCFIAEISARTPVEAVQQLIQWVGTDLVNQHLKAVITQKLIRTLCDDCKQAFRPNPQLLKRLNLPPETTILYRAPSPPDPEDEDAPSIEELCEDCAGVPFHGRTAAYEILEMTEGMKEVVVNGLDPKAVKEQMAADGMRTLQKDAVRLVVEGKTALEEVQRTFAPSKGRRPKARPRPRPDA